MPPELLNHLVPTPTDTPAATAASRVETPPATAAQNASRVSRRPASGRRGENTLLRPAAAGRRFVSVIATSRIQNVATTG
jgi:hypothetical protein